MDEVFILLPMVRGKKASGRRVRGSDGLMKRQARIRVQANSSNNSNNMGLIMGEAEVLQHRTCDDTLAIEFIYLLSL